MADELREKEVQLKIQKENEWSILNVLNGRFGLFPAFLMYSDLFAWIALVAFLIGGSFWFFF